MDGPRVSLSFLWRGIKKKTACDITPFLSKSVINGSLAREKKKEIREPFIPDFDERKARSPAAGKGESFARLLTFELYLFTGHLISS